MSYYEKINELYRSKNTLVKKKKILNEKIDVINDEINTLKFIEDVKASNRIKKEKDVLVINNVKQMHDKPNERCYIYSINNVPLYQLDFMWRKNQRWYGWVGVTTDSSVTSIINPFFPMSDTAKGAIENELGKRKSSGAYGKPDWPIIIYEFKNFEQIKKYFPPPILSNVKYINYKTHRGLK